MTLSDLLDTLRTDYLRDVASVFDGDDPRLWSDTTLIRYINEAQNEFAKRTLCVKVKTSITTVAYQANYDLDPTVFAVMSARFLGNGSYVNGVYTLNPALDPTTQVIPRDQADMGRTGHSELSTLYPPDRFMFDVNQLDILPPGKPLMWTTDEYLDENATTFQTGITTVHLYPIPSPTYANCVISLRVNRLPTQLTDETMEAEPEIPMEYHLKLLDYAAYMALGKIVDGEAANPQQAQALFADFKAACETARREIQRKTFVPLGWGFGHNAFSFVGN